MTPANVCKTATSLFVAFLVLTLVVNIPDPIPFCVGIVAGGSIGLSGQAAYQERNDRRKREEWNRMWR
jgi:hypothetical protein